MRLQRRLFVIYTVCFLMFMILCNCKLVSFFSNINTDKKTKIVRVSGRLYSLIYCDSPCIIISRVWQSSSYNSNFYEMLIKQMSLQPTYTLSQKKSVICSAWWLYLFCAILDFDRNNLYSHFCFSELLILREKKVCWFTFGPLWSTKQKLQIFKKYFKNTIQESCTKKVQFCTRRRKSHFFDAPCIYWIYVWFWKQGTDVFFQCSILSKPKEYKVIKSD